MQKIERLIEKYAELKTSIDERLGEFKALYETGRDADLFLEMCFCTCTPQNNARRAWEAALNLKRKKLLLRGQQEEIAQVLRESGVRFHNNKASFIVKNRELFLPKLKSRVDALLAGEHEQSAARNLLAQQVFGWGLKEASHFLRNTGHGDVCILDRHILRKITEFNVIPCVPPTLPPALYVQIEDKMKKFAESVTIPIDALDLLFWHEAKGELFK